MECLHAVLLDSAGYWHSENKAKQECNNGRSAKSDSSSQSELCS